MNTLSYGLLSLLALVSTSGYDLMRKIQPFWPARHSQIYPLLARLEKAGMVEYACVPQADKPDKKIYSITPQGREALKKWLAEPPEAPAMRDELTLKAYSLCLLDPADARRLLDSRLAFHREQSARFEEKLAGLLSQLPPDRSAPAHDDPLFGPYLLLHRAISNARTGAQWCEWAIGLLPPDAPGEDAE